MESNLSFMGFQYPYENSKVAVLQVPYGGTSTYLKGQELGPKAILEASLQVETYDIELKSDYVDILQFHTLPELKVQKFPPKKVVGALKDATDKVLTDGKFPLIFGGEHSITTGAVQAAFSHFEDLCVLQIDAHADMRDEFHGSRFNHGCVMSRIREMVPAVSVGIRSYCSDEAKIIGEKYSDSVFGPSLDSGIIGRIISKLPSKHVFITIDIDGFDPSIMPATGTPEPGGLLWNDTLSLLKRISQEKTVVGADIVELAPRKGDVVSDFACAKLAYKLCGYCLL